VVTLVDFVNVPPEPIAGWRGYDDFDCRNVSMTLRHLVV
jgi:hypothetical protein